jgi:hypothetical protein
MFYRIYPYLIILIAFSMGVVFFNAIDCVLAWYNKREATNFEFASFLFVVSSLSFMPLAVKFSTMPEPEDNDLIDNK